MGLEIDTRIEPGYGVQEYFSPHSLEVNQPASWTEGAGDKEWEPPKPDAHLIILDPTLYSGIFTRPLPEVGTDEPVRQAVVEAVERSRDHILKKPDAGELEQKMFELAERHERTHAVIEEKTAATSVSEDAYVAMELTRDVDEDTYRDLRARQMLLSSYLEALVQAKISSDCDPWAFSTKLLEVFRECISDDPEDEGQDFGPDEFILDLLWEVKNSFGVRLSPHRLEPIILTTGMADFEDRMWNGEAIYRSEVLPRFFEGINELADKPEQFIARISQESFIEELEEKVTKYTNEQYLAATRVFEEQEAELIPLAVLNAIFYNLDLPSEYEE